MCVFFPCRGTEFVSRFIIICKIVFWSSGTIAYCMKTFSINWYKTFTCSFQDFPNFVLGRGIPGPLKTLRHWTPPSKVDPWTLLSQRDFETRPKQLTIGHDKMVDWHAIKFHIRILREAKVFCNCRVAGIREKSWGKRTLRKLPRFPFLLWKQPASTLMSQTR